jgi:hypothetical protein
LSILCHLEGEEVFSFADSDTLALVCASASDGALGRNTSAV